MFGTEFKTWMTPFVSTCGMYNTHKNYNYLLQLVESGSLVKVKIIHERIRKFKTGQSFLKSNFNLKRNKNILHNQISGSKINLFFLSSNFLVVSCKQSLSPLIWKKKKEEKYGVPECLNHCHNWLLTPDAGGPTCGSVCRARSLCCHAHNIDVATIMRRENQGMEMQIYKKHHVNHHLIMWLQHWCHIISSL